MLREGAEQAKAEDLKTGWDWDDLEEEVDRADGGGQ
jgi:hypothetical protein